ncbi:MAG TPA: tRNA lysidine(34) synthetase TilS [Candidatus Sulfopaludibacter sp.]|nr:tRNA lysidine(34) synthetase TilS [Candidatus Sulfopaludibacter sp.]
MTDLLQRVAATIARYAMLRPGDRVAVAVSGGADSVCLLHILASLAYPVHILHLNHHLRGAESDQDAEFVRGLGFPATIRDVDFSAIAGNLEQAARQARLAFFKEAIAAGVVDRVAVGHTRSDQAETVLFRFLRGSGSAGLSGIRPVTSDGLIRPLIELDRADVEQYLRQRAIPWREDSTNASLRFARNQIRHSLMPLLAREWNPAIAETLAHTAVWAQGEEAYWEAELDRLAPGRLLQKAGAVLLCLDHLPEAAARRLIRRAIEQAKGDLRGIDFRHVEAVLAMARRPQGHGHVSVPGLEVVRSFEWIRLSGHDSAAPYRLPAAVPGIVRLPGTGTALSLELIERRETFEGPDSVYNCGMGWLDWHRVSSPLEFRSWAPGDRYQPLGSSGTEKIKTLFHRARIPLWERRGWPVLWDGSAIVWARRFGPSSQAAANSSSTVVLQIRESDAG